AVQPMNTTDGHGTYSEITVVDWRVPGQAGGNGQDRPALRIAVGFLLARGRGMPRDLKAKFAPLAETTHQPDGVVVLWPVATNQKLPAETSKTWDSNQQQYRAVLRHLSNEDVCKLLALPDWVK